ncbi:sulfite exporter TauE/SafE family protein [candidate division WOR-3 bacterium]|nr:sulfite exporter TauE/SafE family protein [candidate division WOR-3 bacterium]
MNVWLFMGIIGIGAVCEFVDSSIGMGYSTLLSPVLLGMGFDPLSFIPAVLLSQALGGLAASIFHQRNRNVSFTASSKDSKIFWVIVIPGVLAIIGAAILALNLPRLILSTCIGGLVIALGVIILLHLRLRFTYKGMVGVGLVSAFVEGIAGCGFGPIVTSGQIISGHNPKRAIGVTTTAEVPICITGFLTYIVVKLIQYDTTPLFSRSFGEIVRIIFSNSIMRWDVLGALLIGVVAIAPLGPLLTRKIGNKKWHFVLGPLIILLGAWVLIKTHFL